VPCLPCADGSECDDTLLITFTQTRNHKEPKNDRQACNPFCNCSCCVHIIVPNFQLPKITVVKPLATKKLASSYSDILLPSSLSGNIWQPPKLI
jgi:hypothetical protein